MDASPKSPPRCRALLLTFALLACCSSGCLCAFHQDWQLAKDCCPADNLAGRWEGTWVSRSNGHHGKIRAVFVNCGNGTYKAHYQGSFCVAIPFVYKTTHQVTSVAGGITRFTASEDLGPLVGGTFAMNGWADGNTFVANFSAADDCGVFKMQRVGSCGCCSTAGCAATDATSADWCATESCAATPYDDCQ